MVTSKAFYLVVIVGLATCNLTASEPESISFNSQIRPILSEYCFACHGPDEEHRAADLRLDLRDPAIEYGAIVDGEPDESLLIERIHSDDPDSVMPPPETRKTLTAAQKDLLELSGFVKVANTRSIGRSNRCLSRFRFLKQARIGIRRRSTPSSPRCIRSGN